MRRSPLCNDDTESFCRCEQAACFRAGSAVFTLCSFQSAIGIAGAAQLSQLIEPLNGCIRLPIADAHSAQHNLGE